MAANQPKKRPVRQPPRPKVRKGMVEVTVNVDNHTHKGSPCPKGKKLTVTKAQAKWMSDNRIIEEEIK